MSKNLFNATLTTTSTSCPQKNKHAGSGNKNISEEIYFHIIYNLANKKKFHNISVLNFSISKLLPLRIKFTITHFILYIITGAMQVIEQY